MNKKSGFTVIEILVVITFLIAAGVLFVLQRGDIEAHHRDSQRKTAINAFYYNLEEVFYKDQGFYPETIDEKTLTAIDPQLFTDPTGVVLGQDKANYRYETRGCDNGKCQKYTLRADLEKEDDFIKNSRN